MRLIFDAASILRHDLELGEDAIGKTLIELADWATNSLTPVLCHRHVVPDGTKVMVVTDVAGGLSIYFRPEVLPAFSEIAQKLPSTSFIPENLFPSISARHDVMDSTGKFNPRRSCHPSLQSRQSHKSTADPYGRTPL
jgi:hypothetical protein